MDSSEIIQKTLSVCPACLKAVDAQKVYRGGEVFLTKNCKEHGYFETIIWKGNSDYYQWNAGADNLTIYKNQADENRFLPEIMQTTCCIILNVTERCNLDCYYCLADSGKNGQVFHSENLRKAIDEIASKGMKYLQISGGEPSTRSDLPELINYAVNSGISHIQLNTNGVRLGEEESYSKELHDAGLSNIFMQFDGIEDESNVKIRKRRLIEVKENAIENCSGNGIGVTLVPTLVRGINSDKIGEILKFAISKIPKIRGVHFQPLSYFGRVPDIEGNVYRLTIDELVLEIELQTGGLIMQENLLPSGCDHPLCGFHGDFVENNGSLMPLSKRKTNVSCCCDPLSSIKNREFTSKRWKAAEVNLKAEGGGDLRDMEFFLNRIKTHSFTITGMLFQDAGNVDIARLRNCSLHIYDNGKIIPFCSKYLSKWEKRF